MTNEKKDRTPRDDASDAETIKDLQPRNDDTVKGGDAAIGQATGKRMHKPLTLTIET